MKYEYPGDPEFARDNYWLLPYEYVLQAVNATLKRKRERLHDYERPIAMLAVQQAEMHRDPKKRKKPFSLEEFCIYSDIQSRDLPDSRYSTAARLLLDRKIFPCWALFVYKDLVNSGEIGPVPNELALISNDCIILAPSYAENECHGMLIAMESASNSVREMRSTNGNIVTVRIPKINNKVVAMEDCSVRILY